MLMRICNVEERHDKLEHKVDRVEKRKISVDHTGKRIRRFGGIYAYCRYFKAIELDHF